MKWLSLNMPLTRNIPVYKNLENKKPLFENTRNFQEHGIYESTLHLPMHTGTHIDYPLHAIDGGKTSSDFKTFPAFFKVLVIDLSEASLGYKIESIGTEHLKGIDFTTVEAVFFKTLSQPMSLFDFEFPWLNREGARFLSEIPLKFVGIDQLGIERNQPDHETHISLLSKDILIIEGLDLSAVQAGLYDGAAFTLGVESVEAEPIVVHLIIK